MSALIRRLSLILIFVAGSAHADVLHSAAGGFTVQHERIVAADRSIVWQAAVGSVGQWWSDDHTVAGVAAHMSIDARPMGCFCEKLQGEGGVVHLVVTSVSKNVMLRMTGGLGPLGLMGVSGNMTWEFFDDERGTRVRFTYAVGGYAPNGLDKIAEPVDYVIGEALDLLIAHVEPENEAAVD